MLCVCLTDNRKFTTQQKPSLLLGRNSLEVYRETAILLQARCLLSLFFYKNSSVVSWSSKKSYSMNPPTFRDSPHHLKGTVLGVEEEQTHIPREICLPHLPQLWLLPPGFALLALILDASFYASFGHYARQMGRSSQGQRDVENAAPERKKKSWICKQQACQQTGKFFTSHFHSGQLEEVRWAGWSLLWQTCWASRIKSILAGRRQQLIPRRILEAGFPQSRLLRETYLLYYYWNPKIQGMHPCCYTQLIVKRLLLHLVIHVYYQLSVME